MDRTSPTDVAAPRPRRTRLFGILGVLALGGVLFATLGYPALIRSLGGAWEPGRADWRAELSPEAAALLDASLDGLDPARVVDFHVHVAGIGTGETGCEVHPHMRSWATPLARGRFEVFLSGAGVGDLERADQEYAGRLDELFATMPLASRGALLAFDRAHDEAGEVDPEHTEFHVPNEYVFELADASGGRFVPVMSVHPYRLDALEALERWAARGGRLIKWLPNSMGMDPASPKCDAYYAKMVELDLTLLSHTGEEQAVDARERQKLGNPLRLRRALDAGVRVIAAHCASLGEDEDLDLPEGARERVPSLDLFLRMMDEERYEGLLFGEISATTQFNRLGGALQAIVARRDLHPRLVFASDYPLPALNVTVHLGPMVDAGLLAEEDVEPLRELYRAHPLAFDLALKRRLLGADGAPAFDVEVFHAPDAFGL